MTSIRTVGVVGAGQMGAGIAHVCALGGREVRLFDVAAERLTTAVAEIRSNLARQVGKGVVSQADADAAVGRIKPVQALEEVAAVDLVIEAATEDENTKKAVFTALTPHLRPDTLLASNTARPERFLGLHCMKPAAVTRLGESIGGVATANETYEAAAEFARSLGKTTTDAEDFPAFIVNRVLVPMINEAIYTLYEGVGDVVSIDTALKPGANHPRGPLELADFMGLDVGLAIMNVLHGGLAGSEDRPCPRLVKYVEAGWLGRKAGRGFYDYRGETPVPTR